MVVVMGSEATIFDDATFVSAQSNFAQLAAIKHPAVCVVVTLCSLATVQEAIYCAASR